MSPQAAKTRDFDQLERRCRQAAKLLDRGLSQTEVARRVNGARISARAMSSSPIRTSRYAGWLQIEQSANPSKSPDLFQAHPLACFHADDQFPACSPATR